MKLKRLYIIGASGLGREVESCLEHTPVEQRDWEIAGFLHSYQPGKSPLEGYPSDYEIVGDWETFPLTKDDYCVIAVADCSWREKIYHALKDKVTFLTYIHPTSMIYKFAIIGEAVFIAPYCIISTNVKIENGVMLNSATRIGHDSTIGNFTSLMADVDVGGWCTIGEKVFMGTKSTLIPHKKIANNAIVGAGAVVIRNVKEGVTVFGNPAKEI
ncbi:MAG: acetyltransferase [Tannerella sp.]|jgi:sugar O-acyltransferase (sialic acid O-acetyltransferase NeuD family)|nr:acetyltransferase [Tannerella sp.]